MDDASAWPAPRLRWLRHVPRVAIRSAAVVCAVWAVVRLSGVEPFWPLSALLALTPWVAPGAALVAMVGAVARYTWATVTAGAAAMVVLALLVPRAWGAADHRGGVALRVMTVNLRVGGADAGTVVRLVRDHRIDLLALQEFTPAARDRLHRAGLDTALPHRVADPEPFGAGSALYSRYRLTGGAAPVDPGGFVEASATVRVPSAPRLAVRSVHPCAPFTAAHQDCWRRGLAAEPRPGTTGPIRLLLGDFNATLDHPALRRLVRSGYRDAADGVGAGLHPTWPADLAPAITLDHVLADQRIGVRDVRVYPVPGTDHRALTARLTLPRG